MMFPVSHIYTSLLRFIGVLLLYGTITICNTYGQGSYGTTTEPNYVPKRTAALATTKIPTNEWWTSLAWGYYSGNYSGELYADPLSMVTANNGLRIRSQQNPLVQPTYGYFYNNNTGISTDMTVGLSGLNASATNVDGFSDWIVTADWNDGARNMKATFGHGLPFVYFTRNSNAYNATISFAAVPSAVWGSGNAYGMTVNGVHYGIFAPTGSTWTGSGTANWASALNNLLYFSVAVLPDNSTATLNLFAGKAFAFVTNSQVSWNYNPTTANLTSTFTATITPKEAGHTTTIMAMYRHQWLNSTSVNTSFTYPSARGEMKVTDGNSFTTVMKFNGIVPALPRHETGAAYITNLQGYINGSYAGGTASNSYDAGKWLNRLAQLTQLAEQEGAATSAKYANYLGLMKTEMEDWFTAGGKEFMYNSTWGVLSPPNNIWGELTLANDHHFHYGYFIHAAALVARYDPAWASTWSYMVETLIKDVANWDITADNRFPRLKNFDSYAGHSWASGHCSGWMGCDQESSSESINFAAGVILWGVMMNKPEIRDLGIFLYTNEVIAIEQYWFDINNAVFPAGYTNGMGSLLRGNGIEYATFWDPPGNNVSEIHGIELIPITGASLYLGRNPTYINSFLTEVNTNSDVGGVNGTWRDFFWSYEAFSQTGSFNAADAVARFNANSTYTPEIGESQAHTYHYINNLNKLGQLSTTITGNFPTSAVFVKGATICYVGYNPPGGSSLTINFSNGASMSVAPNELKVLCDLPLAITLIDFEIKTGEEEKPLLLWNAATETSAGTYFIIERSNDNSFDSIGFISGSHGLAAYQFTDRDYQTGTNYYRLRMIDENGNTTFSPTKIYEGERGIQVYPTFVKDNIYINFPERLDEELKINLISSLGVKAFTCVLNPGNKEYTVSVKEFLPGTYFLIAEGNDHLLKKRIIIVK